MVPVDLGCGFNPIDIDVGGYHVWSRNDDQEIKCFGGNQYGHEDSIARGDSNGTYEDIRDLSILDLGKNENGDYLEIVRFDSAVLQTVNPTTDPTTNPTKVPTITPTTDPTNDPTTEPTPSPTAFR